jgi:hypothetical protein
MKIALKDFQALLGLLESKSGLDLLGAIFRTIRQKKKSPSPSHLYLGAYMQVHIHLQDTVPRIENPSKAVLTDFRNTVFKSPFVSNGTMAGSASRTSSTAAWKVS